MPGALLERPKMTRAMYQALKRHIIKEREKKKQEQEQDAMMERLRKERELKKKKEEEDSLTLEQTKEQCQQLEQKLETLKREKHDLFSRLKKVLHQEDERRKTQIKEQNEIMIQQGYPHSIPVTAHPILQLPSGRPTLYKPQTPHPVMTGVKRQRSPSPPPSSSYQGYSDSNKFLHSTYPAVKQQASHLYQHQQAEFKPSTYTQSQPTHVTYSSQPGHTYQQQNVTYSNSQSPAAKYTAPGQSAFTTYPAHYAQHQQKPIPEAYPSAGYAIQRMQQQGYMGSPHSSGLPMQQQLEHANQKSGFNEEKYKIQQAREPPRSFPSEAWPAGFPFQRGALRGKAPMPGQQPSMIQQQIQMQQAQPKGSIVTGFPARSQAQPQTSSYQTGNTQQSYPGQQGTPGRPN